MNIKKEEMENAEESEDFFLGKHEQTHSEISVRESEYLPNERDLSTPASDVNIDEIISMYIPVEKIDQIKSLIRDVITKKHTKQQIITRVNEMGIDPVAYNRLIIHFISFASQESAKNVQTESRSKVLKLKGALKDQFLMDIKKDLEDPAYNTKTHQQYSLFKRTPEDLSSAVSNRPQLISLFSANYNVLCCKIKRILSVKDLHNRLKKGSFEYKLSEQVTLETAKCTYAAILHYIKETIGKCLNIDRELDRNMLISTMFGNVRGAYLLYNNYPPS
ncbi:hypothetical protein NEIRO03_0900 [Nematocida sp. AWRm78]|nr:hypothetical protein NEIRO02_0968 [Nematocida sp. AWRm79]KAI5183287.1 hypothetical protein NEIRO03_0900 [Nematocida sp. AWRm78]